MSKKILMVAALLFSMFCTTVKADNYRALMKKVIETNISSNETSAMMKTAVYRMYDAMVAELSQKESLTEADKAEMKASFDKYIDTHLNDAIVDLMLPCFKKNLTEQQLKEYTEFVQHPLVQSSNKKSAELSQQWALMFVAHLTTVISGKELTLPTEKECPTASYKEKLDVYIQKSGMKDLFMTSMNSVLSTIQTAEKDKFMSIINKIYPAAEIDLKNLMIDKFTEEELTVFTDFVSSPSYAPAMEATKCVVSDHQNMLQWGAKFMENWAKEVEASQT